MKSVQILPAARERLLDIWQYTAEKWNEEQADLYLNELINSAHSLPGKRHLWRPVREKRFAGVFFFHCQHHYLFFKELADGTLGILTVLHENMDLPKRLHSDL